MEWSNQLIAVLDELGRRFGIAIDWTQQNIVPYALDLMRRIVLYRMTLAVVAMTISLSFMVGVFTWVWRTNKKAPLFKWYTSSYSGHFENGTLRAVMAIILMSIALAACFPVFIVNTLSFIRCLFLPEIIVVRYIQGLLN